jgi:hypothetical protein
LNTTYSPIEEQRPSRTGINHPFCPDILARIRVKAKIDITAPINSKEAIIMTSVIMYQVILLKPSLFAVFSAQSFLVFFLFGLTRELIINTIATATATTPKITGKKPGPGSEGEPAGINIALYK